jgi:ABC-2 type transport system permease protein
MPAPIQLLTHVISARYFVSCLQTLFLAGTVWPVIVPNLIAMTAIALFFLVIAARLTRQRLD